MEKARVDDSNSETGDETSIEGGILNLLIGRLICSALKETSTSTLVSNGRNSRVCGTDVYSRICNPILENGEDRGGMRGTIDLADGEKLGERDRLEDNDDTSKPIRLQTIIEVGTVPKSLHKLICIIIC